jgi:hypothetical protein
MYLKCNFLDEGKIIKPKMMISEFNYFVNISKTSNVKSSYQLEFKGTCAELNSLLIDKSYLGRRGSYLRKSIEAEEKNDQLMS